VIVPTERREENVEGGKRRHRSGAGAITQKEGGASFATKQPAGEPQARSVGGRRFRRELALGGDVNRERVAVVEDRGWRAADSGYWMVIGGIQTTPGVSRVPVSNHFSTSSNLARRAASSPARLLAN